MYAKKSSLSGFTLLEVMVVIAIVGILLALAAPSFNTAIKNNQLKTTAMSFQALLKYSRAEAMRTGESIALSPGSGYIKAETTAATPVEIRRSTVPLGVKIDTAVTSLQFDSRGFITSTGVTTGTREFIFCDSRSGEKGQKLSLLETGVAIIKEHICT